MQLEVLSLLGDDALQDVSQVGEQLNAVEFARLDQCIGDRPTMSCAASVVGFDVAQNAPAVPGRPMLDLKRPSVQAVLQRHGHLCGNDRPSHNIRNAGSHECIGTKIIG
ncbi:MAG TPA: hypothetical protein VK822_11700 [Acetobacteraceae bacterium]|nr:hypothetical protein [Acetobacteraceae bacterium]